MFHKRVPTFFSKNELFTFTIIIRVHLKGYFARKQSKTDYSKIFEKMRVAAALLFVYWFVALQWKMIIKSYNFVGTGDHKVGKMVAMSIFRDCQKDKS